MLRNIVLLVIVTITVAQRIGVSSGHAAPVRTVHPRKRIIQPVQPVRVVRPREGTAKKAAQPRTRATIPRPVPQRRAHVDRQQRQPPQEQTKPVYVEAIGVNTGNPSSARVAQDTTDRESVTNRESYGECDSIFRVFKEQWIGGMIRAVYNLNFTLKYQNIGFFIVPQTKQFTVDFVAVSGDTFTRTIHCQNALKEVSKHTAPKGLKGETDCTRLIAAKAHVIVDMASGTVGGEWDAATFKRKRRYHYDPRAIYDRHKSSSAAIKRLPIPTSDTQRAEDCEASLRFITERV